MPDDEPEQPFSVLFHPKDNPVLVASGYAKIARYVTPHLIEAGYPVKLHCPIGHQWNTIEWEDPRHGYEYEIVAGGDGPYGENVVPSHMHRLQAESDKPSVLLFCGDVEGLNEVPERLRRGEMVGVAWTAVDWLYPTPQGHLAKHEPWLSAFPMSGHAEQVLRRDGLENVAPHVPLGVDPNVWQPMDPMDFPATGHSVGFREDTFNVVSIAANQWLRKGMYEMLAAVGEFHKQHPEADTRMYLHTQVSREWNMPALLEHMGLQGRVEISDDYTFMVEGYSEEQLAQVMNWADVVLALGFEGFGLQTIEAQACGTPVIGLDAGATPELLEYGALVPPKATVMWPQMVAKQLADEEKVLEALELVYEDTLGSGETGRRWVHDNYTWDHTGHKLLDRLDAAHDRMVEEEVLGPPDPGPRAEALSDELVVVD